MSKGKILIVDDEETLREGLQTYLEMEGYETDSAASSEDALKLDLKTYDLFLLDIMMSGMSGKELAAKLKANSDTSHAAIIFLTAKDSDDDMVAGLKIGADDYIAKPYSIKNVLARIEAVLRRTTMRTTTQGVTCDRNSLTCNVDGSTVIMPRKEFEILSLLVNNPGRIFTREEIMHRVWPEKVVIADRSVDVHITRIRNKIAPYGKCIISRSGYGYGWQD